MLVGQPMTFPAHAPCHPLLWGPSNSSACRVANPEERKQSWKEEWRSKPPEQFPRSLLLLHHSAVAPPPDQPTKCSGPLIHADRGRIALLTLVTSTLSMSRCSRTILVTLIFCSSFQACKAAGWRSSLWSSTLGGEAPGHLDGSAATDLQLLNWMRKPVGVEASKYPFKFQYTSTVFTNFVHVHGLTI